MNATVIGGLIGGVLVFLSSILVPIISKRLNKAADAATSAKELSESAVALATGFEKRIESAERRCEKCDQELAKVNRRLRRRDRSIDAIHTALLEVIPLMDPGAQTTAMLRAVVHTIDNTRHDEDE